MKDYYNVDTASNPNTSSDILRKILERGNKSLTFYLLFDNMTQN
jgi:hypothetical protein